MVASGLLSFRDPVDPDEPVFEALTAGLVLADESEAHFETSFGSLLLSVFLVFTLIGSHRLLYS